MCHCEQYVRVRSRCARRKTTIRPSELNEIIGLHVRTYTQNLYLYFCTMLLYTETALYTYNQILPTQPCFCVCVICISTVFPPLAKYVAYPRRPQNAGRRGKRARKGKKELRSGCQGRRSRHALGCASDKIWLIRPETASIWSPWLCRHTSVAGQDAWFPSRCPVQVCLCVILRWVRSGDWLCE